MPRRPRHHRSNAVYHAVARGVDRQPIFLTDNDRRYFLESLKGFLGESDVSLFAHSLMPNHFHLELGVGAVPLSIPLHAFLTQYSVRFNRLYARTGHLFESRFWSKACENLDRIENQVAYIHLNPVRARLATSPENWEWSSHQDWSRLRESKLDLERLERLTGRSVEDLGSAYVSRIETELAGGRKPASVDELILDVASAFGLAGQELMNGSRGEHITRARRLLLERAKRAGHTLADLARGLNCTGQALYMLKKRSM